MKERIDRDNNDNDDKEDEIDNFRVCDNVQTLLPL